MWASTSKIGGWSRALYTAKERSSARFRHLTPSAWPWRWDSDQLFRHVVMMNVNRFHRVSF
jgi:hypothetical protein